jgi:hypothetical protein
MRVETLHLGWECAGLRSQKFRTAMVWGRWYGRLQGSIEDRSVHYQDSGQLKLLIESGDPSLTFV